MSFLWEDNLLLQIRRDSRQGSRFLLGCIDRRYRSHCRRQGLSRGRASQRWWPRGSAIGVATANFILGLMTHTTDWIRLIGVAALGRLEVRSKNDVSCLSVMLETKSAHSALFFCVCPPLNMARYSNIDRLSACHSLRPSLENIDTSAVLTSHGLYLNSTSLLVAATQRQIVSKIHSSVL